MEGYLQLRINPWVRRLLTRLLAIVPALFVIYYMGDQEVDKLLVLSQVILSLQLGFAIIPLIHFVSDRNTMGEFTLNPWLRTLAWLFTAVLVYLNVSMVINELSPYLSESGHWAVKLTIVGLGLVFGMLLLYITFFPWLPKRQPAGDKRPLHPAGAPLKQLAVPAYQTIAVALEFGAHDEKLLAYALGQGKKDTTYLLIHVVESATARLLGESTDDYETRSDAARMQQYVDFLQQQGHMAIGKLGFHERAKEIARIIGEEKADMLVIGAHRHAGVKDWIYGETINTVRHEIEVPILVVNL